jgi:hypothetical protein
MLLHMFHRYTPEPRRRHGKKNPKLAILTSGVSSPLNYYSIWHRKLIKDIAGMGYRFNSPIATVVELGAKHRLAVAPRHRQRNDGWNCVVRSLVPSHRSLVCVLYPAHFSVVLYLRKFLLFHMGVYELMTSSTSRIKPGQYGLGLHRFALGESDRSFVGCR